MLHTPVLWYFDTSVTYPQCFRRVKIVLRPPRFVQQQYLWNTAIQPTVGCYNSWAAIQCSGCSQLVEISLWNGTIGSALVQIMDCQLFGASHYLNQCWVIINWTLIRNKLKWNFNQITKILIHKNASENIICEMAAILSQGSWVNTLRPRQNGRRFPDDIFKYILLNESVWISLKISLKFIPKVRINNIPALVQIMAWRRPGDKPLSEPMMDNSLTHICVTRPQWVNRNVKLIRRESQSSVHNFLFRTSLLTWINLTHLPLNKMATISQTTFSSAFSWMKRFVFWFEFHWSFFLRVQLTIFKHWFR